jgi:hypothetical protein
VKTRARNPIAALLALISILLSASATLAEDYSVDFGADTDRGRDAGTLHCQFGKACDGKMESLGVTVRLQMDRGSFAFADVRLEAGELGCCYFANTTSSIVIDPRKTLSRVPLFRGRGPRGALFIENEPAGNLYLRFRLQ